MNSDTIRQPAPPGRIVMRHRWHDLLFVHWRVDPTSLQQLLPPGLEIDLYEGEAYVAMVPFWMTGVAPSWFAPIPGLSDMLECNVRTYVRHLGSGAPGVWFFSLDASNAAAVAIARASYLLPYFFAQMRQSEERFSDRSGCRTRRVRYAARRIVAGARPARCRVEYDPYGPVGVAEPGSVEEFLIERYVLYAYSRNRLFAARVHHDRYQLSQARLHDLDETLIAAAGITQPSDPPLVHYCRSIVAEASALVRV